MIKLSKKAYLKGANNFDEIKMNNKISIVIVDDDPSSLVLMSAYLKDTRWNIRVANDGQEAINSCLLNSPDIVVADLQMPKVDGFMLLNKIRESKEQLNGKIPKFILLTASAISEVEQEAKRMQVDVFLIKPLNKARFFQAIETVMKNN